MADKQAELRKLLERGTEPLSESSVLITKYSFIHAMIRDGMLPCEPEVVEGGYMLRRATVNALLSAVLQRDNAAALAKAFAETTEVDQLVDEFYALPSSDQ